MQRPARRALGLPDRTAARHAAGHLPRLRHAHPGDLVLIANVPGSTADQWTLIFDGECGVCRAAVELLRSRNKDGRLSFVPFQDSEALARLPNVPRDDLERAMHLVAPDREVLRGAAALPAILRLIPGGAPLALLYRLPAAPWLAARVYRMVARSRYKLGLGARACPLDGR
ncbi:MAG: thiol-disulfide oxidoreductase DCC family protein [Gemmatimonadales bacterium]